MQVNFSKERTLTFGEGIEVSGLKDEILETVSAGGQYYDKIVTIKLRKIARISRVQADNAIRDYGLVELGWKPTGEKGRLEK